MILKQTEKLSGQRKEIMRTRKLLRKKKIYGDIREKRRKYEKWGYETVGGAALS
jgi:hypothetical protein